MGAPPPEFKTDPGHPYHHHRWWPSITIGLVLIMLPFIILFNVVYLGYELAPNFQPNFKSNVTFAGWWGSTPLPGLLGLDSPPCESKDIGRGDTFRVSASLFDYTVMSTWNSTNTTSASQVQAQQRMEYTGESFANCSANTVEFDYSLVEETQTITVGVTCPGSEEYPVFVSMQTEMVFAWLLGKDFVGQYYGPSLGLLNINDTNPTDYRKLAFAVLEAISTDSLTIMRGNHLSNPVLSISVFANISFIDGIIDANPYSSTLAYVNGTEADWPAEADIYVNSIVNLMKVAAHTVNLDLGFAGPESIYRNFGILNKTISPNLAPPGITPANWAQGGESFYYGPVIPPYQTWAQMILAGQEIKLGNVTGLPRDSSMVTLYLCSNYQLKPIRSLMTAVFVGTQSMVQTGLSVWVIILAFCAFRLHPHCEGCRCDRCRPSCLRCECPKCKRERAQADQNGSTSELVGGALPDDEGAEPEKRPGWLHRLSSSIIPVKPEPYDARKTGEEV